MDISAVLHYRGVLDFESRQINNLLTKYYLEEYRMILNLYKCIIDDIQIQSRITFYAENQDNVINIQEKSSQ